MSLFEHRRTWPGTSWFRYVTVWSFAWGCVRWSSWLLFGLRFRGTERIPPTGALVYVGNHRSHLDPPLSGSATRARPCACLARSTLFDNWLLGFFLRFVGSVPLDQTAGARGLRFAVDELKTGRSVMLFPEGTRMREPRMGPFFGGFMLLIRRAKATVVPVAIDGSHEAWPPGQKWPRFGRRVAVQVGEPIPSDVLLAMSTEEAVEYVRRAVELCRLEARATLRERSGGRYPPAAPDDVPYWEQDDAPEDEPEPAAELAGRDAES